VVTAATNEAQQLGLPAPFTWSDVEANLVAVGGTKGPCSLTGLTKPRWDFPVPRYKPENPADGVILPDASRGFLMDASVRFLRDHGFPAKVNSLVGQL
jgi:hypothetical protein